MGEESRSQSKARETVIFDQMFHESTTSEIHGVSCHFNPFHSISYYFTTFHSIFASGKFCHVTLFPETWRPMFAGVVRSRGSYPAWVRERCGCGMGMGCDRQVDDFQKLRFLHLGFFRWEKIPGVKRHGESTTYP